MCYIIYVIYIFFLFVTLEISQWIGTLTLAEDPVLIPSTQMSFYPISGNFMPSWLLWSPGLYVVHKHAHRPNTHKYRCFLIQKAFKRPWKCNFLFITYPFLKLSLSLIYWCISLWFTHLVYFDLHQCICIYWFILIL